MGECLSLIVVNYVVGVFETGLGVCLDCPVAGNFTIPSAELRDHYMFD